MKRITAFFNVLLLCAAFSVISFADDIYIVDDGEDAFIPTTQATTEATTAEVTTAANSSDSLFGDFDNYLSGFSNLLGEGFDSIVSGLEGGFNFGGETTTSASEPSTSLPQINSGEVSTRGQGTVQTVPETTTESTTVADTTAQVQQEQELPSVLVVNNASEDDHGISGSTLTLMVFIAAVVILILVAAIVLVLMTRRTEYNSAVMDKSTIPSVEKPKAMGQLSNDNIADDGNDYGNIAYWND